MCVLLLCWVPVCPYVRYKKMITDKALLTHITFISSLSILCPYVRYKMVAREALLANIAYRMSLSSVRSHIYTPRVPARFYTHHFCTVSLQCVSSYGFLMRVAGEPLLTNFAFIRPLIGMRPHAVVHRALFGQQRILFSIHHSKNIILVEIKNSLQLD